MKKTNLERFHLASSKGLIDYMAKNDLLFAYNMSFSDLSPNQEEFHKRRQEVREALDKHIETHYTMSLNALNNSKEELNLNENLSKLQSDYI